ncbi:MAG: SIS domain-containing protein [Gammaproteobacteria bacterium]|nr:MAG: SIS domain-containing protein [Gammaproteobacteria bacterium]
MENWIQNYFRILCDLQLNVGITNASQEVIGREEGYQSYIQWVQTAHEQGGKVMFIGNGGSAGIASHVAIDYSKNGHIRSMAFSDSSAITCLSNDCGYENVFAKQIEFHGNAKDVLVAISSSGRSKNILEAVAVAKKLSCKIVTFSGFDQNNSLRQLGDLNFYIASHSYGFVEVAHLGLIHSLLDYITEVLHQPKEAAGAI